MKNVLRVLCLMLCLTLLPLSALAEETQEASAPNIRVLLRRLNLTDRADLTLDGVYTAAMGDEPVMSFPRGSQVTVQIRQGNMYLFYEGMSLRVGQQLRLIRHAAAGQENTGIRFEKNGNFYPGELLLTIEDGLLKPVLTISVEDYLLGVVPYEMSNAFPLEALKAQAVCARTYALSKVNANKDYDVVDTTNDQVFRGVNLSYDNAIRAVQETAGVVGTYNGALAICYYSASNGGQTELVENVWSGRGDWGYYAMTDDPYDLENPESIVRRATLRRDATGLSEEFKAVLAARMSREMASRGFTAGADCLRIDAIESIALGGAAFEAPSRYLTEMEITFRWSGRSLMGTKTVTTPAPAPDEEELSFFETPAPTVDSLFTQTEEPIVTPEPAPVYSDFVAVEEPLTLTIDLFPEAVKALKLSISGADNELITLVENEDSFVLEARRYGHGVGMSQRGAQWMAGQYGKLFHEILKFYYPGMVLMRVQAGDPVLPTAPEILAATPAPPATPTPRPTLMPVTTAGMPEGAWLASVEHIEDDSSLNLRSEPSQASEILMRLYKHQQLIVLETCEDPAWVHVKTDAAEGYVMTSFLEKIGQ